MNDGYWPDEGHHSEECRAASKEVLMGKLGVVLCAFIIMGFTAVASESAGISSDRLVEAAASFFGVVGTVLLATKTRVAGWGFVAFLASNLGWLWFSHAHGHIFMFWQQVAFLVSSLVGVWVWLVKGR